MKTFAGRIRTVTAVLCYWGLACAGFATADDPPPKKEDDRPSQKQAKAYRELFEKVGRSGLADLTKDKDTGVALHASWELHKKLVKADPKNVRNRSGKTYDPDEVKKFLAFLKDRTKATVPDWWVTGITDLEVWEDAHAYQGEKPKFKEIELGKDKWHVREGITLTLRDKIVTYKSGDISLEFPRTHFSPFWGALADLSTEKVTYLAGPTTSGGFGFRLYGLENKSGKQLWAADVWAIDREILLGNAGYHRVEMTHAGDTVFVFGAEANGMYVEAFDLGTGKCQFRFCSTYWQNPSEKWALK